MKIKVAIVDTAEWIDFLINIILRQSDDIEVVWSDSTATNTLLKANSRRTIDIILAGLDLIDKWYGGSDIIFGIKEIKKVKVITLMRDFNEAAILKSFTAGAVICLSKSNFTQIPEAIRNTYFQDTKLIDILIKDYRRLRIFEARENLLGKLNSHQREVIELYILGYQIKEIATMLNIKPHPVQIIIQRSVNSMYLEKKRSGISGYREDILKKIGLGIMDERVKILAPSKRRTPKQQIAPGILWELNRQIRVGIINDQERISTLLDIISQCEDIEISWQIQNLSKVFQIINSMAVDIILIDLNLIKRWYGGYDIIYGIAKLTKVKVIILTPNLYKDSILCSYTAGAVNCLSKSNLKQLPETIRKTYHNECPLLTVLINDYRRLRIFEAKEKLFNNLSPIKKEVLNLYISNYLVKEIAIMLNIKSCSVSQNIYRSAKKIGLKMMKPGDHGEWGYRKDILKRIGLGIIDEVELRKKYWLKEE